MRLIDNLLRDMYERRASDLFIKAGQVPTVRVDGIILPLSDQIMSASDAENYAYEIMSDTQKSEFIKTSELDLAIGAKGIGRFRVNVFRQRGSVAMVLRHIPAPEFDFDRLNLPPAVKTLADRRRGMVLVTGTTGSGKSTTLACMMYHINKTRKCHIITIEDPIEFLHSDNMSIISQREIGIDTESFGAGLRHVLRQSPDVILIGEMRDLETIQTCIASAETGHLVFSTLHTTDAVQTVERIINYFPGYLQHQIRMELSLTLQGVISQRLLPLQNGKGRVPATEVMVVTPIIKKLLYDGKTLELKDYIQDGAHVGMMTFDQSLLGLYHRNLITMEEALSHATSPDEFRLAADGISSGIKAKDFDQYQ
ncbi:TPA: type IV pili twitching motility protein PilT [Candidatus Sumerlaeota bacterium]|jgi:twitching motility protein PilT|nr:type IV pili twitching motility protein PilT [Candidatus Sumerlaeota bacterium]